MRLRCVSSSLTTLERPTSEPVPRVVGSATKYGSVVVDGPHLRMVPGVLDDVAGASPSTPTTLATSSAAPPPKPITQSARCAGSRHAGHHLRSRSDCRARRRTARPRAPRPARRERAHELGEHRQRGEPLSVTISGRFSPRSAGARPRACALPAPKWMVVGNAKRVMLMVDSRLRRMPFAHSVAHLHPAQLERRRSASGPTRTLGRMHPGERAPVHRHRSAGRRRAGAAPSPIIARRLSRSGSTRIASISASSFGLE